ncbi:hypothetical protein LA080_005163 [Diaporthe eres]|nr:hypothetical protein LA080_005163 [Diaporthe eres]
MELASIWIGAARTAARSSVKAKKTNLVFIVRLMADNFAAPDQAAYAHLRGKRYACLAGEPSLWDRPLQTESHSLELLDSSPSASLEALGAEAGDAHGYAFPTCTTTTVSAVHINGWVFTEETGSPECTTMVSNTSSATGDGALSNGNKIGIGIGGGMGIVGLATLAAGLFMMRRARRVHHPRQQQEQQQQQQQATQKDGPGWYSASAHPGAHRDSAAVGDRYVAPPTELSST